MRAGLTIEKSVEQQRSQYPLVWVWEHSKHAGHRFQFVCPCRANEESLKLCTLVSSPKPMKIWWNHEVYFFQSFVNSRKQNKIQHIGMQSSSVNWCWFLKVMEFAFWLFRAHWTLCFIDETVEQGWAIQTVWLVDDCSSNVLIIERTSWPCHQ